MGLERFSDLSMVPKPSVWRGRSGNQNSWFPLQGSMKNDALMNDCVVVLEKQIFLGVMELIANGLLSGQNCFRATWLLPRISLVAHKLIVSTHSLVILIACTIQWSNKPDKWNMHSTVTKGKKRTRTWEKGSLSLITVSIFKLSLDLCWNWLGRIRGMW